MKKSDVNENVSSFLQNLENQIGEVATRLDRAVTQFVKLHERSERLPNKVTLWKELDAIGDVLEGLSQKGETWATRVEMSRQQLPSQVTQKILTECQTKF